MSLFLTDEAKQKLHECSIPTYMHESIIQWVENGRPVGDFLRNVIENDLSGAFGHGDRLNIDAMEGYVRWFYNYAPLGCALRPGAYRYWPTHLQELKERYG
jgi:hypothetical protein